MTQEITRWLTEIRTLQHQLAAARQERDQAYGSAANWRQLYEAEATQRRTDVEQLQMVVSTLRTELAALRGKSPMGRPGASPFPGATAAAPGLDTVEGLRTQLLEALQECDRLQKALDTEQANHPATRQTLTSALGETIDALKDRSAMVHHPPGELAG